MFVVSLRLNFALFSEKSENYFKTSENFRAMTKNYDV